MNVFLSIKYVKFSFTLIKVIISTDLFEFDCIHCIGKETKIKRVCFIWKTGTFPSDVQTRYQSYRPWAFQYPTYSRSNSFCLLLVFVTVAILANDIFVMACTLYIWSYYEFYKIIKMFVNVGLNDQVKVFVINIC
jgi:hypothetical protein